MNATTKRLAWRARWNVARLLDRLPGQCWADLCTWALFSKPRLPWSPNGGSCRTDFRETGACYCGKLRTERQGGA